MSYDYLIIGAGLYGAVFANKCKTYGLKCLVIDKKEHVAGNCFTYQKNDICIHSYGPHIFHTNSKKIWDYINTFDQFNNFINRPKVNYNNKIFSFPINLFTLYQLWGINTPEEARAKLNDLKIKINNPTNLEEYALSVVGEEIYYTFIYGYTKKQWMCDPKDLPSFILKRIPIRLNFDDNYYNDEYQGIPTSGYTHIIENMLDGCDIILQEDYFKRKDYWNAKAKKILFTGRIDEFFDYEYGQLNYRTLRFENLEFFNIDDYQGNAIINYTSDKVDYTRIIEHKHFNKIQKNNYTIITKEYPEQWTNDSIPYYPINNSYNNQIFSKYELLKTKNHKFIFGGRLAEYKYYDMDQIIGGALAKKII